MFLAFEGLGDDLLRSFEQFLALFNVDEPAAEDLGRLHELSGLLVDRRNGDDHTIGRKVRAVTQNLLVDIADAQAIDVHIARRHLAGDEGNVLVDLEDVAVAGRLTHPVSVSRFGVVR